MKKQRLVLLLNLFLIPLISSGQISKPFLTGNWETVNEDSIFHSADTIKFIQNINQFVSKPICRTISWEISKRNFAQYSIFKCTEPGRKRTINLKQKLKLKNKRNHQEIHVTQGKTKEIYIIVKSDIKSLESYPYEEKILILKRKK